MPKKGKKGKKDKKSKGSKEKYVDPNFQYSSGRFTLPNGDIYVGDYCAHRKGLIWREGQGLYWSKDGQGYKGEWKDDKLVDNKQLKIYYPNGDRYFGAILKDKYSGFASYELNEKLTVSSKFFDNKPTGVVGLIDIYGRIWSGEARPNEVFLLPENEFYNAIPETYGIGKLKKKYREVEPPPLDLPELDADGNIVELSDRDMEKIVFAESTKTDARINFAESKWCQRYLRYKKMRHNIKEKLKSEEASTLTEDEEKWQQKYKKYKDAKKLKKSQKIKSSITMEEDSLLKIYHSPEFQHSSEPIKVFRPTEPVEEENAEWCEEEDEKEDIIGTVLFNL